APKVIRSPEAVVVYQTLAAAQLFQPQRILAASKQRQLASASPPLSFLSEVSKEIVACWRG
ncbi:hypothetical protein PF006_g27898, partial [Phytophthora fragariae]